MKTVGDINKVLIVGAGTLGLRIALRCALDGYQVTMYDISEKSLAKAVEMQAYLIKAYLKKGILTQEMIERAKNNLSTSTDLAQSCKGIDLISESIIENIDIKREFYKDLMKHVAQDVIITTNTSYLMPSELVDCIDAPERFAALHFHDVFTQTVVDIMPHPSTAIWVNDLLMEFGRKIHQIPVFIKKESPGYIFNAMLMAVLGQAGSLAVHEVGSIQDIDRSFMGNFGTAAGPFGMMDQVGLDTALHIVSARSDRKSIEFAAFLKTYVDQGKLGFKTGEGFYTYPNPEFTQADFLKP